MGRPGSAHLCTASSATLPLTMTPPTASNMSLTSTRARVISVRSAPRLRGSSNSSLSEAAACASAFTLSEAIRARCTQTPSSPSSPDITAQGSSAVTVTRIAGTARQSMRPAMRRASALSISAKQPTAIFGPTSASIISLSGALIMRLVTSPWAR